MNKNPETKCFHSLEEAFAYWSEYDNDPKQLLKARAVIDQLRASNGDVFSFCVPKSHSYVSVTFNLNADQIGAYIKKNYVDHRVELHGSVKVEGEENIWRTYTDSSVSHSRSGELNQIEQALCPNDYLLVTYYGECHLCGWRPQDH